MDPLTTRLDEAAEGLVKAQIADALLTEQSARIHRERIESSITLRTEKSGPLWLATITQNGRRVLCETAHSYEVAAGYIAAWMRANLPAALVLANVPRDAAFLRDEEGA